MSRTFHHFHDSAEPRNERRAARIARRTIERAQEREQRELTALHREGATGPLRRSFA